MNSGGSYGSFVGSGGYDEDDPYPSYGATGSNGGKYSARRLWEESGEGDEFAVVDDADAVFYEDDDSVGEEAVEAYVSFCLVLISFCIARGQIQGRTPM